MKVAIVSEFSVSYFAGGGEQRYYELARQLVARGHDVTWVTMKQRDSPKRETIDGIRFRRIGPRIQSPPARSIPQFLSYMIALFFHFLTHQYDMVDAQTFSPLPPTWFACLLTGQRMLATIHDVAGTGGDQWTTGGSGRLERFICRLPYKRIITVSEFVKRQLVKHYDIPSERIAAVHNGIDTSVVERISAQKKTRDLIFVGRMVEHKHPEEFIKAVNGWNAAMIGDGPLAERVKRKARRAGVEYLGRLASHEDVLREIKRSRVLVLPSTREGLGLVIAEAGACGVPTVAYRGTGVEDIITEKTGVLVAQRDVKALRKAVDGLLRDDARRKRMGTAMKKRVMQRFTNEQMAAGVEQVYKEVL